VIAYLYLPKHSSPPYQTIIYFPGIGAFFEKEMNKSTETKWFIDYLLKSGRAVMCPVYKGTFERNDEPQVSREGHQYTEWIIKWTKDFSRSVDYLETRSDIDNTKIAYYGHSWGGVMGGIIPAVENRLALCVFVLGGLPGHQRYPEADPINYVSRITIPVLMLNGRYDSNFPLEETVRPFYKLLGTPEKNKRLVVYDTDHYVEKSDMVREVLDFLDKYLGPVNHISEK
jgi:dipeptidyl aminopeptidase/acylaminoacyl peptidase